MKIEKNIRQQLLIAAGVVAIFFIGLSIYQSRPLSEAECYRLGSNEKMALCLAKFRMIPSPTPAPTQLSSLQLISLPLEGSTLSSGAYPVLEGTLRNKLPFPVRNIIAKVTFYKYGTKNCDGTSLDTKYVEISTLILSNDSQRISTIVNTQVNTTKAFTWCVQIASATQ